MSNAGKLARLFPHDAPMIGLIDPTSNDRRLDVSGEAAGGAECARAAITASS
jgi:hypothetical protein